MMTLNDCPGLVRLVNVAFDWGVRCFGKAQMYSKPYRALRMAEEAIELAQVCDVSEAQMKQLVKIVYSRPPGKIEQEIGGVMVTLTVFCKAQNFDPINLYQLEIERCLSKPESEFIRRNAEKDALGLKP